jgi:hypothetical protein
MEGTVTHAELCSFYFHLGLAYSDILQCLVEVNGALISLRALKRILQAQGLFCRKVYTDVLEVAIFIE